MQFIGLAGPAGAGKDSVADVLVEQHGFTKFSFSDALYREVYKAFGVPEEVLKDRGMKERRFGRLKIQYCTDPAFTEILRDYLAKGDPGYHSWAADVYEFSPRQILQLWGTEYRRAQDPNYWVERAARWVEAFLHSVAVEPVEGDQDFDPYRARIGVAQTPRFDSAGLVNTSARFPNEQEWIRASNGQIWHVKRPVTTIAETPAAAHVSETGIPSPQTGDKILVNNGTLAHLATGVALALQGNDIVNATGERWL